MKLLSKRAHKYISSTVSGNTYMVTNSTGVVMFQLYGMHESKTEIMSKNVVNYD